MALWTKWLFPDKSYQARAKTTRKYSHLFHRHKAKIYFASDSIKISVKLINFCRVLFIWQKFFWIKSFRNATKIFISKRNTATVRVYVNNKPAKKKKIERKITNPGTATRRKVKATIIDWKFIWTDYYFLLFDSIG